MEMEGTPGKKAKQPRPELQIVPVEPELKSTPTIPELIIRRNLREIGGAEKEERDHEDEVDKKKRPKLN